MERSVEHGGSLTVDLNENEPDSRGGKDPDQDPDPDRDLDRDQGIRKGKGKGWDRGTGIEGNVNRDAPAPHQPPDLMPEKWIPDRIPDRLAVVSGVYGDLNGFPESSGEVEPVVVGGGGGAGGGGGEGGGGGGAGPGLPPLPLLLLTGTTTASCPAVLRDRVSQDAGAPGMRSDVNMPNGGVDGPGYGASPEGSRLASGRTAGLRDVRLANGGLHIVIGTRTTTTTTTTCDWPDSDSDYSPGTDPDSVCDPGAGLENGVGCGGGCGSTLGSQSTRDSHAQESLTQDSPTQDPPTKDSPTQDSPTQDSTTKDPPTQDSTNQDSPTQDSPTEDSPTQDSPTQDSPSPSGSSANPPGLGLPLRPQTLRTNPALVVSLSCDATPLSPEDDGGFYFQGYEEDFRGCAEAGRRQSAPDQLPDRTGDPDCSDTKLMPKRFGIAEFFTRSLFSRKPKEPKAISHNASGWRLFGKTAAADGDPAKDPAPSEPTEQCPEEDPDSAGSTCPHVPAASGRRKNLEFEPLSTTALILEDRPANLPAKSLEETQRHKMEYEEMVAGAKRRELKEAQKKKRQMKERHRQEDSISNAMIIWNNEILPHWDTMKGTRRVRELWWQGLPPSVRGRVWSLAIGNELNITPELYEIFLSRAKEKWRSYSETSSVNDSESDGGASLADRESSLDLIKLDISRTFPSLFIFQKGGPYHDLLHSVLGAYTCYRPDIGYVQGMSFIAAVLILNLEEAEAFITFANLLNKPCQMAFFRVDHELMLKYFSAFEVFFEENLPRLFSHFQTNNLTPDLYLIDWIFTLYSKPLPLDVACRVWDVFCRDGEESLFRTGLGILRLFQDVLLQMDFIHMAQFLTRLPEDLQPHTLFHAMASTHMVSRNRRWAQVFSALMKDGTRETDKSSSSSSPALRS